MYDYELLDVGGGARLERFGPHITDRPFAGADRDRRSPAQWQEADLRFDRDGVGVENASCRLAEVLACKSPSFFRTRPPRKRRRFQKPLNIQRDIELMLPQRLELPADVEQHFLDHFAAAQAFCVNLDQVVDERVPAKNFGVPAVSGPSDHCFGQFAPDERQCRQRMNDIADRAEFYDEDVQPINGKR